MRVAGLMAGVGPWVPIPCNCRCSRAFCVLPSTSQLSNLNLTKVIPSPKRAVPAYVYDPYKQVDLPSFEDEEVTPQLRSPSRPKENRINIVINNDIIKHLDLSPAHKALKGYAHQQIGGNASAPPQDLEELIERTVGFIINYEPEDPYDIRELSEMSDVRLWFVRLDAAYPWLPVVLDWQAGELAQYTSMLVPHQISRRLGVVFNPEALQLFVMRKLFIIFQWLQTAKVPDAKVKVIDVLGVLGFKIDSDFFKLLETS